MAHTDWPMMVPSAMPMTAGEPVADGHALQRGQHAPAEPDVLRTGDEERIDDQVAASLQMVGAGSVAPGRLHSICQTISSSARITSGGRTRRRRVDSARQRCARWQKLGPAAACSAPRSAPARAPARPPRSRP